MAKAQVTIEGNPNNYTHVSAALMDAVSGDVILIAAVTITDEITIDKNITLRGAGPTNTILQAAGTAVSDGLGKRVISLSPGAFTITIENLTVRHGNAGANGGGIFSDKITGLVTLKNLIIENNYSGNNGGGLAFDGSNASIIECTIRNNTSAGNGGGIIIAPNTSAAINCNINIQQSLIDTNTGFNGGGIWINGANANSFDVNLDIENSTISNNTAGSGTGAGGGGAILSTSPSNVTLTLVHSTIFNNTHAAPIKAGLRFVNTGTNFSAYNSIIVGTSDDLLVKKAISFANTTTTDVVNCILGGLDAAGDGSSGTPAEIIDDPTKNNLKGRTATESGLDFVSGLQSLGGNTQVYAILDKSGFGFSTADDHCTATVTGITLPPDDQRGATREGTPDAGAFEFGVSLSTKSITKNNAFRIYPNPTQGLLYIKSLHTLQKVVIFDITGKSVFSAQKIYNNTLDVSGLSTGLYNVQLEDSQNNVSTKKLVISR